MSTVRLFVTHKPYSYNSRMPAQPLTPEQQADAKRLMLLFKKWQAQRRERGEPYSQDAAAELMELGGSGQSTLSQYLRGVIPLNVRMVAKCSALLACAPEEISPSLAAEIIALATSTDKHSSQVGDLSKKSHLSGNFTASLPGSGRNVDLMTRSVGDSPNFRRVYVVGKAQGGLPERIWTDGDHLVGAIDEYAEIATPDPQAFICPVVGDSMYPRFMPGEYVLVEPSTPPKIGGTVLVRLATGETMLKKLDHRANGHVHLSSWNDPVQHTFREEDISWIYYVAHMVPPEKIKMRF